MPFPNTSSPSRPGLRVLCNVAAGCSFGGLALLAEERRRRVAYTQAILENARILQRYKSYQTAAPLTAFELGGEWEAPWMTYSDGTSTGERVPSLLMDGDSPTLADTPSGNQMTRWEWRHRRRKHRRLPSRSMEKALDEEANSATQIQQQTTGRTHEVVRFDERKVQAAAAVVHHTPASIPLDVVAEQDIRARPSASQTFKSSLFIHPDTRLSPPGFSGSKSDWQSNLRPAFEERVQSLVVERVQECLRIDCDTDFCKALEELAAYQSLHSGPLGPGLQKLMSSVRNDARYWADGVASFRHRIESQIATGARPISVARLESLSGTDRIPARSFAEMLRSSMQTDLNNAYRILATHASKIIESDVAVLQNAIWKLIEAFRSLGSFAIVKDIVETCWREMKKVEIAASDVCWLLEREVSNRMVALSRTILQHALSCRGHQASLSIRLGIIDFMKLQGQTSTAILFWHDYTSAVDMSFDPVAMHKTASELLQDACRSGLRDDCNMMLRRMGGLLINPFPNDSTAFDLVAALEKLDLHLLLGSVFRKALRDNSSRLTTSQQRKARDLLMLYVDRGYFVDATQLLANIDLGYPDLTATALQGLLERVTSNKSTGADSPNEHTARAQLIMLAVTKSLEARRFTMAKAFTDLLSPSSEERRQCESELRSLKMSQSHQQSLTQRFDDTLVSSNGGAHEEYLSMCFEAGEDELAADFIGRRAGNLSGLSRSVVMDAAASSHLQTASEALEILTSDLYKEAQYEELCRLVKRLKLPLDSVLSEDLATRQASAAKMYYAFSQKAAPRSISWIVRNIAHFTFGQHGKLATSAVPELLWRYWLRTSDLQATKRLFDEIIDRSPSEYIGVKLYDKMIAACVNAGDYASAQVYADRIQQDGVGEPSINTGSHLLLAHARQGHWDRVEEIFRQLEAAGGSKEERDDWNGSLNRAFREYVRHHSCQQSLDLAKRLNGQPMLFSNSMVRYLLDKIVEREDLRVLGDTLSFLDSVSRKPLLSNVAAMKLLRRLSKSTLKDFAGEETIGGRRCNTYAAESGEAIKILRRALGTKEVTVEQGTEDKMAEKTYVHGLGEASESSRRVEREMKIALARGSAAKALEIYEDAREAGLAENATQLVIAVEACLRLKHQGEERAKQLISAAEAAGLNVARAKVPLLTHEARRKKRVTVAEAQRLMEEAYAQGAESGRVDHHTTLALASRFFHEGQFAAAHGLLTAASKKGPLDLAGFSLLFRVKVWLLDTRGVTWVVGQMRARAVRLDKKFMMKLKWDLRRLRAEHETPQSRAMVAALQALVPVLYGWRREERERTAAFAKELSEAMG